MRVGCTSRCTIPRSFRAATAETSCLKMERVWNRLICVLQNYFHILMCSGASHRKTNVFISSKFSALSQTFSRFSWLICWTVSIKLSRIYCLCRGTGEKSTNETRFRLLWVSFHSITISPSSDCEYRMSGRSTSYERVWGCDVNFL